MKFSLTAENSLTQTSDCLIVGVFEDHQLSPTAQILDQASGGKIQTLIANNDMNGKIKQTLFLYDLPGVKAQRVLLVGCGKKAELNESRYIKIILAAMAPFKNNGNKNITNYLTELEIPNRALAWKIRQNIEYAAHAFYTFHELKTQKNPGNTPDTIQFSLLDNTTQKEAEQAIQESTALIKGIHFLKNLANLPGNICTPTYIAEQAIQISAQYKSIKTTVLDKPELEKLGMNCFLAVASGSTQPPKFIVLEYHGGKQEEKPVVFVGKGITFDTGGISIKPALGMEEMKYDMCGAATILGAMMAVAELNLPINLIGVIATTENMPSGSAVKPGDIVTSMSGQTVEIINTDAEGRLILCDALTYAERYNPDVIIDLATLTGAIIIALGGHPSGLFSNDETLATELKEAGEQSYDRVWQLPIWEDYQPSMDSEFADIANVSNDRSAGSILAACFLARFTKKQRWAHLDIAATAHQREWCSSRGATGRPLPLLLQFCLNRAKNHK